MALEKVILDNGLTVYNDHVPGSYINNVSMVIPYGSVHEKDDTEGIAHVFEHCVRLETDKFANVLALREYAQLNGMVENATTTHTRTQYYGNGISLEPSFTYLSEVLQHPHFSEDKVSDELRGIRREALMKLDEAGYMHMLSRDFAIFGRPYGRTVIGRRDNIDFSAEELIALHKRYYSLGNMALVVTGMAQMEEVIDLAYRYFSADFEPAETISQPAKPTINGPMRTGFIQDESPNVRLSISHPLNDEFREKRNRSTIAYSLASTVISRACFELLRYEKGLSYDGAAGFDTYNHPNAWAFDGYVTIDADKIEAATGAFDDIFSRNASRYTDSEIQGAIAMYKYGYLSSLSSLGVRTDSYVGKLAVYLEPRDMEASIKELDGIDIADVRVKIDSIVEYISQAPRFTHLTGTRATIGDVDVIIDKNDIS